MTSICRLEPTDATVLESTWYVCASDAHLFMSLAELRRLGLGLGRDLTGLQAWWTRLDVDSSGSLLLTAELR